jgi:hypothetical protein
MQTTIESKVAEISIDQKLAALKEISEQKDVIDKKISELNYHRDPFLVAQIGFVGSDGVDTCDLSLPEVPSAMIVKIVETYLKSRREELIAKAQHLMK